MKNLTPDALQAALPHSIPVVSGVQKFVLPVPVFADGGEPLAYPANHPKAGQPIVDYEGKPVGERGILFVNGKDNAWQAAPADGQSVIILNEVSAEQADALVAQVGHYHVPPDALSLPQLKQVLTFARETLGLIDVYNSTNQYVASKLQPIGAPNVPGVPYGLMRKNTDDVLGAIYVPGHFVFEGPTASPQQFANGGVMLNQNGEWRGIQPDVFLRTYTHVDGRPIASVAELPLLP